MRSIIAIALLSIAAMLLPWDGAVAGIVFPPACVVPRPLLACPSGDMVFTVLVRNSASPTPFPEVELRLEGCPGVQFPPVLGDEGYWIQPGRIITNGDELGQAVFALRAGGTCNGVSVLAFSAPLGIRAVASPDQDGNLGVGASDLAIAEAKLGSSDPTADFDGDGSVTSADLDILRRHLGHYAPGMATPVSSRSWGAIKLLYQ